ncbi:MAG: ROK family protein, partial [Actinomycetota bacterium]
IRVTVEGAVLARQTLPTPANDMQATLDTMVEVARGVIAPEVRAIGIGAAGLVEKDTGRLTFAPNLAWRNAPLAQHLWDALGLPTLADNDANAAAWGEFRLGAAVGHGHVLFAGAGTGIGGGIIVGGQLVRGAHGFAGEIGHIIVDPDGPLCGCGNRGCWEQFASGHAITRAGRDAARQHPQSMIARRSGGDPAKVTGEIVSESARAGDPIARGILAAVGTSLGEGLAGLANVLDPEIVVVGGGAAAAGNLLMEPARAAFVSSIEAAAHRPRVPLVTAALGNDAGAIGAAMMALETFA